MTDCGCNGLHEVGSLRAVDNSSWDGGAAMSGCADAEDASSCYGAICAGKRSGDPDLQSSWALPHHKAPGEPPNAAAVRNALARLPQTKGLTNRQAAEEHLSAHMNAIGDQSDSAPPSGTTRQGYEPEPYAPEGDEPVQCPECGRMNEADAEYCDQCGVKLAGRTDVQVDDEGREAGAGSAFADVGMASQMPRANLIRARGGGAELRSDPLSPSGNTLVGIFSRYGEWYEIDSLWEGRFMERMLPGAFKTTIEQDRSAMKVLFDHGMDASLAFKPLGPIRMLEDREEGPYYEIPLYDTDYNRDFVIPVAQGRLLNGEVTGESGFGSSMRFTVTEERWNRKPQPSKHNPQGLPERSVVSARVFEFGPVTFPANAGATASVRSGSDEFMARLVGDPRFFDDFAERVGAKVAVKVLQAVPQDLRAAIQGPPFPPGLPHPPALSSPLRQARLRRTARMYLTIGAQGDHQ